MLTGPAESRRFSVLLPILVACGLMAACASARRQEAGRIGYAADGAVRAEIVEAPATGRYQPVAGSMYFNPLPVRDNVPPEYPPALLARRLPEVVVVARLVVDGDGAVERAQIVDDGGGEPAFRDAVLSAVGRWTFIPLKRVTGDKVERLPFTQDYRFTFRQVDGRAVVESADSGRI